jgi:DNA-binding Lrp family transcriptional regulator
MGWLSASQPGAACAGHPNEIAARNTNAGTSWQEADKLIAVGCGPCLWRPYLLDCRLLPDRTETRMVPFFVQIKCHLGQSYEVANKLADAELASEIYSTAGDFDLLVKFYVEDKTDIGHFVNEKVQTIPGIQDTRTIITFKAF